MQPLLPSLLSAGLRFDNQVLPQTSKESAIRTFVQIEFEEIRARHRKLDPVNRRLIEPLEGLLHELKSIHSISMCNSTLSGERGKIEGLARKINNQLLPIAVRNNMPLPYIQKLVRRGADIHQLTKHGRNLLMIAAMHADQATVCYLSQNLNPRARDNHGETAQMLMRAHRNPALPGLERNTFFAFDNKNRCFDFHVALCVTLVFFLNLGYHFEHYMQAFASFIEKILNSPALNDDAAMFLTVLLLVAVLGSSLLLVFLDLLFFLSGGNSAKNVWTALSVLNAGLLAPRNTALCTVRETETREGYAGSCVMEGISALAFMSNVVESPFLFIASLLFGALSALASYGLDTRTFTTLCIDYISPLAKCANLVSTVAMVFFSNYPVFAAVNLALYTISLLDNYGYLPMPVQKIYYLGLYVIFVGWVDLIKRCLCCD